MTPSVTPKKSGRLVRSLVAVVLVAAGGCASMSSRTADEYDRGDVPERQFQMQAAACEAYAESGRNTGGQGGLTGAAFYYETFNKVYDACMRSKGFARKKQ